MDAPRVTLDANLQLRLSRAYLYLQNDGKQSSVFEKTRTLSQQYHQLVRDKLGESGLVIATPATEAVSYQKIKEGRAGDDLDQHDRITMPKNRIPAWGETSNPLYGITMTGSPSDLLRVNQDSGSQTMTARP